MSVYRTSAKTEMVLVPRSKFKTFLWKLKLFFKGNFKSRFVRCEDCNKTISITGDKIGKRVMRIYHKQAECNK